MSEVWVRDEGEVTCKYMVHDSFLHGGLAHSTNKACDVQKMAADYMRAFHHHIQQKDAVGLQSLQGAISLLGKHADTGENILVAAMVYDCRPVLARPMDPSMFLEIFREGKDELLVDVILHDLVCRLPGAAHLLAEPCTSSLLEAVEMLPDAVASRDMKAMLVELGNVSCSHPDAHKLRASIVGRHVLGKFKLALASAQHHRPCSSSADLKLKILSPDTIHQLAQMAFCGIKFDRIRINLFGVRGLMFCRQ